jgi:spectinomycin phosphotransferase
VLTPPAGLDEATVAEAAARWWGLRVKRLSYVALGAGSYHWQASTEDGGRYFLTVDDLLDKPWLGADPDPVFAGLRAAFGTALALRERARLPFVVAPLPAHGGDTACRLTPGYSLAVFPFVVGQTGRWGALLTPRDRDAIAGLLARLHLATPAVASSHVPRRGLELYGRAVLETALAELGRPWLGGPFAEQARQELAARADIVTGWMARFDDLAARMAASGGIVVVTHGEPHAGNIIRTGDGLALIDWDTVALGPPERDLWMLDDGSPGALDRYRQLTDRDVDGMAISYYRLAWTLSDIAAYTGDLRSAHRRSPDTERALRALRLSLEPDPAARPAPFRYSRG